MFNEESFLFPARAPRATIPSRAGSRALAPRTGRHAPMPGASIGYQSRRLQRRRQTGASRMVTRRSRSESAGPPRIPERPFALACSRRSAMVPKTDRRRGARVRRLRNAGTGRSTNEPGRSSLRLLSGLVRHFEAAGEDAIAHQSGHRVVGIGHREIEIPHREAGDEDAVA